MHWLHPSCTDCTDLAIPLPNVRLEALQNNGKYIELAFKCRGIQNPVLRGSEFP